jgi:hypothetical protein
MRLWEKLVSGVAVAVICAGATYSYDRERLRHADLLAWYQQINQEKFGGKLQDAPVEWGDLTEDDANGMTYFYSGGAARIKIDRKTVTSEKRALEVLRHEECHVFVNRQEAEEHGAMFQECMKRFTQ